LPPDALVEIFFKFFLFFCWVLTYLLIIRRAWLDKVPGMPFPATCLNSAWEGMMLYLLEFASIGWFCVFTWFVLDCVIFVQYFVYARPPAPRSMRDRIFWPWSLLMAGLCAATPAILTVRFQDFDGLIAAYFQNALMSILFCTMLLGRDSIKGQSIYVALSKFLGTLVVVTYGEPSDVLLAWCYAVIVTFDMIYVWLIYRVGRRDGIAVFRRL